MATSLHALSTVLQIVTQESTSDRAEYYVLEVGPNPDPICQRIEQLVQQVQTCPGALSHTYLSLTHMYLRPFATGGRKTPTRLPSCLRAQALAPVQPPVTVLTRDWRFPTSCSRLGSTGSGSKPAACLVGLQQLLRTALYLCLVLAGKGHFGQVWLAQYKSSNPSVAPQHCAIKMLKRKAPQEDKVWACLPAHASTIIHTHRPRWLDQLPPRGGALPPL